MVLFFLKYNRVEHICIKMCFGILSPYSWSVQKVNSWSNAIWIPLFINLHEFRNLVTAGKVPMHGVIFCPCFPVFRLKISAFSPNTEKYGAEINPYIDTLTFDNVFGFTMKITTESSAKLRDCERFKNFPNSLKISKTIVIPESAFGGPRKLCSFLVQLRFHSWKDVI